MTTTPHFDVFEVAYAAGQPQVLSTKLVADLETPVSTMLKLADGQSNAFLLESVEGGEVRGRFSIIGLKPDLIWRFTRNQAEINRQARTDPAAFVPCKSDPLTAFRAILAESKIELPEDLPPMAAGLFGYLAYDAVRLVEDIPDNNPNDLGVPDGIFLRPTLICIFDRLEDIITAVTPIWPNSEVSARAAYDAASVRLADLIADLQRSLPYRRESGAAAAPLPEPQSNTAPAEYMDMVSQIKEYINAGDVFQVVPSQRFSVPFHLPPLALYRSLRRLNPSPFLFCFDFGDFSIVGSSPEILVRLRDDMVTLRPLAGTRPRGATPEEDKMLAEELLTDPKERAEHLMLLDLGRNDVGRVVKPGTVEVVEQFVVERYSHVMHIASHVEGKIATGFDGLDALAGGFPAGTVSGAPKVRAMEIIDELEKSRRGVYAGAVGYFSANGSMDTCIALRTAVLKDGTMYVQTGAGVVADSDPLAEQAECIAKARALIRAAEEAVNFAGGG